MSELMVPTRVDAILITKPRQVTGPLSDFEVLPWFDGKRDHYSTVPYLASAINAAPFAEHTYWLEPGVHLHWALPDGLTRGSTDPAPEHPIEVGDLWFAAAPNRWLIRRRIKVDGSNEADHWDADRAWIVQSDYVHTTVDPVTGGLVPATMRPDARAIAYPRPHPKAGQAPFLYVGRQIEVDPKSLRPKDTSIRDIAPENMLTHYTAPLTALGYGDPAFAAHYPTCRSVFGLFDDKPAADKTTGARLDRIYDVFGWYEDADHDPLAALHAALSEDEPRARALVANAPHQVMRDDLDPNPSVPLSATNWVDAHMLALQRRFGWTTYTTDQSTSPSSLLCVAATHLRAAHSADVTDTDPPVGEIGIGSSAPEAYAAFLMRRTKGRVVSRDRQDQLVQSLAATDLKGHTLDLGPKLGEARHTEQFRAMPGPAIWVIRPREDDSKTAREGMTLPDDLAHDLNALNLAQRRYNEARNQIDAARQELYSDWVHYMRAAYPEGDTDPFRVDLDALRRLIERTRIDPLEELQRATGHLYFGEDANGSQIVSDQPAMPGARMGAPSGDNFTLLLPAGVALNGLVIYADALVSALQLIGSDGVVYGAAGKGKRTAITLLPGEKISAIRGGWGASRRNMAIADLQIYTSFGRNFGPFGSRTTTLTPFHISPPRGLSLVGLYGTDEGRLTSFGALFATVNAYASHGVHTRASDVVTRHAVVMERMREHGAHDLSLGVTPGARYWVPNDPIIALGEKFNRPTVRHGHDGIDRDDGLSDTARQASRSPLMTREFTLKKGWKNTSRAFAESRRAPVGLDQVDVLSDPDLPWLTVSSGENWHPLQVEWQAEVQSLAEGGNHDTRRYAPDFVEKSQRLDDIRPEFEPKPATRTKSYEYLSGRSILNPAAGRLMQRRFEALPSVLKSAVSGSQDTPIMLPLGGFHDQLMMRTPELQLPIADPVGLPAQKAFADRVRAVVGDLQPATPQPDSPFHPVRSGDIIIQRLRVIDSFGRTREWRPDNLHTTSRMQAAQDQIDRATLPVRLSQPARIEFRWLSAVDDAVEANAHPATSPVCGWVIANELDRTVVLYASDGRMVGSVDTDGMWTPAPGDPTAPRTWREIEDRHLARFAEWLCDDDTADTLVDAFLDTVEQALEQIDPAHSATHQGRAMLISRPLALVRAQIDLTPRQNVAQDQSWRALKSRMMGAEPDTHDVEHVRFGVRLGEVGQLNDGLCGYWMDDETGRARDQLFTPGPHAGTAHRRIKSLQGAELKEFPLQVSYAAKPRLVTLLMDPMGVVHATTGILPTKSIALPLDQVRAQIDALRITFATAPVLTPRGGIEVPLPVEPGFAWSWLEHVDNRWQETPHHPTILRDDFVHGFGDIGARLWDRLIDLGRLVPGDHGAAAHLMQADPGASPTRFDDLGLTPEMVEKGVHQLAASIDPVSHEARFNARVVARDGWLQLRALPTPRAVNQTTRGTAPETGLES